MSAFNCKFVNVHMTARQFQLFFVCIKEGAISRAAEAAVLKTRNSGLVYYVSSRFMLGENLKTSFGKGMKLGRSSKNCCNKESMIQNTISA